MKKSKFLMFAAIACSSFFIASCSNDIESNGNGTQGDDATFDVQVVDENPDTRLYLGTDKYNHFDKNDEVAVWSKDNATRVKYACTAEGTTATIKKATGETNVLGNSTKYFAAYPYAAIKSNNKTESNLVQMNYTTDQTYTEAELQSKYKPILVGGTDASQKHLKLYNASAMLKVTFTNNSSKTINSVDVNTNGAPCITNVYNTWSANYSGDNITGISNEGVTDAGGCSPKRVKPVSIASGKSVTIYFMLPIQSTGYTSSKYSFSAYESADGTGTAVITKTLKNELTIERNKIYNLGTIKIPYDPATYAYPYYLWDDFTPLKAGTLQSYRSSGVIADGYKNNWGINNVLTGDEAKNIATLKIVNEEGMKVEAYYVTTAGPTTTIEIPTSVIPPTAYLTSNFNWSNFTIINRGTTTSTITTNAGFYVRRSKSGSTMGNQTSYLALTDKSGFIFFPAYGRVIWLTNGGLGVDGYILRDFGSEAVLWTSTPPTSDPASIVVLRLGATNDKCYTSQVLNPNYVFMAPATY